MATLGLKVEGFAAGDPEARQLPNGNEVVSFSIAVDDRRRNAAGEYETVGTTWVQVDAYDLEAVNVLRSVHKGTRVAVEGRAKIAAYKNAGGDARPSVSVRVASLVVLSHEHEKAGEKPAAAAGADRPF